MIPEPSLPALALRGVEARYGDRPALLDLDLEVRAGEFVALTGPNGSGKTSVLRTLLGFLPPARGTVTVFGTPVGDLSIRDRALRLAWVPQDEAGREDIRLFEYVLYGRYPYHSTFDREGDHDRDVVRRLLEEVGLADRSEDGILELSGGERQRAVLARALAQETPILLLDEPTTHLDIGHQIDLLDRVRRLSRDRHVTVLAALHDLNLAARYATRIVVLSRGRRVADGTPNEVLSEALLAEVWGVDAKLEREARTGLPYLLPRRLVSSVPPAPSTLSPGPVHVVGGGGSASPILRALVDAGYRVTVGTLHLLDTDQETADALGLPAAVEAPFAPLGPQSRERNRLLLNAAVGIVVAPIAVGPSNLANLEDIQPFVARVPTFLVSTPPVRQRDFAEGRAERAWQELVLAGAQEVADLPTLLEAVGGAMRLRASTSPASPGTGGVTTGT